MILKALIVGLFIGVIFKIADLPIPAPASYAGLAGLIGLCIGYMFLA